MKRRAEKEPCSPALSFATTYGQGHSFNGSYFSIVEKYSLSDLFARYNHSLWEDGRHKYNVTLFIGELNEILCGAKFSAFDQATLDDLVGRSRQRGNSNATINRKMAALSKLLRKHLRHDFV